MPIHLEEYNPLKAPKQGVDLHDLIRNERDWLAEVFPGTVKRYSGLLKAMGSVARIGRSKEVHAFIIRPSRHLGTAMGVATVIPDQAVRHPEKGRISGDDIDYWLGPQHSVDVHTLVAKQVMLASAKLALKRRGQRDEHGLYAPHRMFVAVPTGLSAASGYNQGLTNNMDMVGDPAILSYPKGDDMHGITKDGAQVQVYQRHMIAYRERFGRVEGI